VGPFFIHTSFSFLSSVSPQETDDSANFIPHSPVRTQAFKPKTQNIESRPFEGTTEAQGAYVQKHTPYVRAKAPADEPVSRIQLNQVYATTDFCLALSLLGSQPPDPREAFSRGY
jgi:hypothetical protein